MASRSPAVSICLLILASLCLLVASDSAFLVVHKKAAISKLKGAERVTVSISIHNAGTSTAYDVSLNDDNWPGDLFTIVSGNTSQSWEKLDAKSSLAHSFVLEAKEKRTFSGPPAVVTYRMAAKSVLQEALSTPFPTLDLFSEKPAVNRWEGAKYLGIKYGPLALVLTIVGLFTYLLVSPSSKSKKLAKANKRRR